MHSYKRKRPWCFIILVGWLDFELDGLLARWEEMQEHLTCHQSLNTHNTSNKQCYTTWAAFPFHFHAKLNESTNTNVNCNAVHHVGWLAGL
jgi:hypothetical protein